MIGKQIKKSTSNSMTTVTKVQQENQEQAFGGLFISLKFVAIMLFTSLYGCVKEVEQQQTQEDLHEVVFHAGWAPETKTTLQEDGSVWWSPGDEIALLYVDDHSNGKYRLKSNCEKPSSKTDFVGIIGNGNDKGTFYAIYPYDRATGSINRFIIPSVQHATAGTNFSCLFTSLARAEGDNLTFYNVCAGLKFSVAHEGISKVVFQQRDTGVPLTGEIEIPFLSDWPNDLSVIPDYDSGSNYLTVYPADGKYFDTGKYYYAAIAPGNTSLIMSFYTDNQVATKYFSVNSIERSKIAVLKEKDKDLVFEPIDEHTYAALGSNILPDGIDKNSIREVIFHTSSDVTTDIVVPSSIPTFGKDDYIPVYFEMAGTTAHYYTKAERYMMKGPGCVSFRDWKELRTVDLSMFCTSPVMEFNSMFAGCINLENLNLSSFDTSNAYYFSGMFQECKNLKKLDISNFCSKNVKDDWGNPFDAMFTREMDSENGAVAYFDEYTVQKYAKIPDDDINETCVVLILNQDAVYVKGVSHNGYIMARDDVSDITDYSKGGSVAMICRKLDDYSFVVSHEFGHGFAKLADEYMVYFGNMSDWEKDYYVSYAENYGWWSNIDFTDNPEVVKWRKFLNDDRYSGTDIGVYEGATYSSGCWKPSQHSIMNNDADGIFNAPSREAIYKRIHKLAFGKDWQYDYEKFVEYDQKNIAAEKAAGTASVNKWVPSIEPERKSFVKIEKSMTSDGKEKITIIMN